MKKLCVTSLLVALIGLQLGCAPGPKTGSRVNSVGEAAEYAAQHGYTFTLVPDGNSIVEACGVKKTPQIVVVSPEGDVVFSQVGFAEGDEAKILDAIASHMPR